MFFDPVYLLFLLPGLALSLWASSRVRSAFAHYSRVPTRRGYTGAQAAAILLNRAGITDVQIVPHRGHMTDHYDPVNKRLALSEPVYGQRSIAAVGVACHEAGHAIQHARHYAPLHLRSLLVPTAGIGSSIGYGVMILGLLLSSMPIFVVGIGLFSMVLLFQVVTLPVEFDASNRAKKLIVEAGIIDVDERQGVSAVLNAAAWTYVAAVVSTLLTVLYWLFRSGLLRGSDE
ncbi:Putative neutral zinc metallopeptidase [Planctomycetes bacterium Pan216]|uniref:Neutral zinc metallopeptidase n=1 Tax=Kolteria novifilia TaxID=2527975 RepID=A0A518BC57_9BACT|nr:Putative neutral zinc metallopeptidase [Planctomycetes bacterium Pan216]